MNKSELQALCNIFGLAVEGDESVAELQEALRHLIAARG